MAPRDPVSQFLTRLTFRWRMFFVISGAILIHLSLGTYHTFGNMLPYMSSYMRILKKFTIRHEELIWIPTFQGSFPFAMVIGGYLSLRFGPRLASMIGCFTMLLGVYLSSFSIQHSYLAFLFTYGILFGFGQGIAYVVAVACVINWSPPEMVGFASGIVAAGFGISSTIFAPIQTRIVNPENFAPMSDGYFHEPLLLSRVPGLFATLSFVYLLMQTVGLIFICDPPVEVAQNSSDRQLLNSREQLDGDFLTNGELSSDADEEELEIYRHQRQAQHSLTPNEMLRSSTFYFLFAALFCCSFYGNMFYNLYKTFGETFIEDDFFLAMCLSIGSLANAVARVGWGVLTDRTSFQTSLTTATAIATLLLLTMPMTAEGGKWVFLVWLIAMFVVMGATHALFITAIVRCFGIKHKIVNYGFLILSTTLSGIVLTVGSEYLLERIGYNWAFIITAVFPFVAFLLTSAIRITPHGHLIVSTPSRK